MAARKPSTNELGTRTCGVEGCCALSELRRNATGNHFNLDANVRNCNYYSWSTNEVRRIAFDKIF